MELLHNFSSAGSSFRLAHNIRIKNIKINTIKWVFAVFAAGKHTMLYGPQLLCSSDQIRVSTPYTHATFCARIIGARAPSRADTIPVFAVAKRTRTRTQWPDRIWLGGVVSSRRFLLIPHDEDNVCLCVCDSASLCWAAIVQCFLSALVYGPRVRAELIISPRDNNAKLAMWVCFRRFVVTKHNSSSGRCWLWSQMLATCW